MLFTIQREQKEKLQRSNVISFKEIMDIMDAFQIASPDWPDWRKSSSMDCDLINLFN